MKYSDTRIAPYLPSLQPPWVKTFNRNLYEYRSHIPHGSFASLDEFNWYNGESPRFRHPYALYSAGHAEWDLGKARSVDRMLFERDRDNTFLLTDSGGFQVGKGVWELDSLKQRIPGLIKWQEAISDLAVILEVPAWMKLPSGDHIAFQDALDGTNENLRQYAALATGDVPFLNILHGTTYEQNCEWFDKTRWFNDDGHAVGWCFGGRLANDLYLAIKFVCYMLEQGHQPKYLHFLGRGTAESAVIAAIMRRTIPRAYVRKGDWRPIDGQIVVTADASSEFKSIGQYGSIYERTVEQMGEKRTISPYRIRSTQFESVDPKRFPADRTYPDVEGPILGKYEKGVLFGDILATPEVLANGVSSSSIYNLDDVSRAILTAHNVWVKLDSIKRMQQLESGMRRLAYGKLNQATYEMADIMSRLMHGSSNKGRFSDLGEDLVGSTMALWRVFQFLEENGDPAADSLDRRLSRLDEFKTATERLFRQASGASYDADVSETDSE